MYHIAVITSDLTRDWASQELLDAVNTVAVGNVIDPLAFDMRVNKSARLTVGDGSLYQYDAFIMRGFNRGGETDYQYEVLELLQRADRLVVNSPASLSLAESKAQTTFCLHEAGLPVPRTIVTQSVEVAFEAIDTFGKAVLKPLYGSHGADMEIVGAFNVEDVLPSFFAEQRVIYIQEFVPNDGKDIRAFVVGDEVVAAVYRIAREGQWRTNVAQGSTCKPCELTTEVRDLCIAAARTAGLEYTGVDVMEGPDGPVILEVNGAPWWQGLLEATGRNVALDIVKHVVKLLDSGRPTRRPVGF